MAWQLARSRGKALNWRVRVSAWRKIFRFDRKIECLPKHWSLSRHAEHAPRTSRPTDSHTHTTHRPGNCETQMACPFILDCGFVFGFAWVMSHCARASLFIFDDRRFWFSHSQPDSTAKCTRCARLLPKSRRWLGCCGSFSSWPCPVFNKQNVRRLFRCLI